MALACRWRSRPQHQKRTHALQQSERPECFYAEMAGGPASRQNDDAIAHRDHLLQFRRDEHDRQQTKGPPALSDPQHPLGIAVRDSLAVGRRHG
jgi:hypothetical protein